MKVQIAFVVAILVLSAGCLEGGSEEKNKNPEAKIYVDRSTFNLGDTVEVEGVESTDPDGKIVKYMFYYGDGDNSGVLTTGYGQHVYSEPGDVTITLVVWDDDGAVGTASTGVIKINDPPVSNMSIADGEGMSVNEAWVGQQLHFDSSNSYDNDGFILPASTFWDFGDGDTFTGPNATHTYTSNGTYQVDLTVEDNDDATTTTSTNVTVTMRRFKATWNNTRFEEIRNTELYLEDNGTDRYEDLVQHHNISHVWINLTWTDDELPISEPDKFTLQSDNPYDDGLHTVSGQDGVLKFNWKRDFPTLNFWAPSQADAEEFAAGKNMTNTRWTGYYNNTVSLETRAILVDLGNPYNLQVHIEYYEGEPWVEEI